MVSAYINGRIKKIRKGELLSLAKEKKEKRKHKELTAGFPS
jgi:hypothetical protein